MAILGIWEKDLGEGSGKGIRERGLGSGLLAQDSGLSGLWALGLGLLAPGSWNLEPERWLREKMSHNHCVLQCLRSRPGVSLAFWRPDLHVDGEFTAT